MTTNQPRCRRLIYDMHSRTKLLLQPAASLAASNDKIPSGAGYIDSHASITNSVTDTHQFVCKPAIFAEYKSYEDKTVTCHFDMFPGLTNDSSSLVQLVAWCWQATNHYLNHWQGRPMTPYGVTGPKAKGVATCFKEHSRNYTHCRRFAAYCYWYEIYT